MKVVNKYVLDNCAYRHADSKKAINKFIEQLMNVECNNHNDLLHHFPKADYVGKNRYVFDIRGNNYRVVCMLLFLAGTIVIRFAGNHSEYDKIDVTSV